MNIGIIQYEINYLLKFLLIGIFIMKHWNDHFQNNRARSLTIGILRY